MSRAERRAYQRMTKNQDPYALPAATGAAKVRMERQKARRAAAEQGSDPGRLMGRRGLAWTSGGAAVAFLLGLSLTWGSGGQMALVWGALAAVAWVGLALAFAWWRRRERLAARMARGSAPRR